MVGSSRGLPTATPSVGDRLDPARRYLGGRRTFFVLVAFVCGLALNWNWLVIAGLMSLLLAVSSCIAMCAADTGTKVDNKRLSPIAPDPSSRIADRAMTD
jgi:hypothetical protein